MTKRIKPPMFSVKTILQRFFRLFRKKKFRVIFFSSAALLLLIILSLIIFGPSKRKNEIIIHYVRLGTAGPLKTKNDLDRDTFSQLHQIALTKYLSDLGDKLDVSFKIVPHYCNFKADSSLLIYKSIAEEYKRTKKPYLVIDNTWQAHLSGSADIIRKENIPVISLNADHAGAFKNTKTIFVGYNDKNPDLLSTFISKALNAPEVNLIYEKGYHISESLLKKLEENHIKINNSIELPVWTRADSAGITNTLKASDIWNHPETPILLNSHADIGKAILNFVPQIKAKRLQILAPVYCFPLTDNLNNKLYSTEFIILDESTDRNALYIKKDMEHFLSSADSQYFKKENTPTFLIRCRRAVDIIETIMPRSYPLTESAITDSLPTITRNPIDKYDNLFYYDKVDSTITFRKNYVFRLFRDGNRFLYPKQLNHVQNIIPNITFGMEIESIYGLNLQEGKFNCDFYYWIKADTTYRASTEYITFKDLTIINDARILSKMLPGTPIEYSLHKATATCTQKFNPFYYPGDAHTLTITTESLASDDSLIISFDNQHISFEELKSSQINLEGWKVKKTSFSIDTKYQAGQKGLADDNSSKYHSLTFYIDIKRKSKYEYVFFVVPYFIITLIAIFMMLLRKRDFQTVGESSIGLVVGTIAYSISISGFTPSKGNLILLDYISGATLFVVLLNLALVVLQSSIFFRENRQPVVTRKIAYVLMVLYFLSAIATILLYILHK